MIAIDTNLLIYAHRSATPEHQRAQNAINESFRSGRGWGISQPSLAEFWSIVTHQAASGRPSTPAEASAFLKSLIADGGAQIWLPRETFPVRITQLAVDLRVRGARIFDLQIALIAAQNGASEIWTHDKNFVSIPGLRVVLK